MPERIGTFRLLRELGRGGMGIVYEAIELPAQRRVALKVLRKNLVADHDALERFQRETQAAGSLQHPNIIPIYLSGEENGTYYYAMEYIEGQTLSQWLQQGLPTPSRAAQIAVQVALGLAHAHRRGVIHRDIKPSNIMIAKERILVMDFGLAKPDWGSSLTTTGMVLGTPTYMSPEQAQGLAKLDRRSDIYSLGATLYEILTGRPPFAGANGLEILQKVVVEEPREPKQCLPTIPQSINTIVLKAMEKDPSERYTTAEEMAEDLQRFLLGQPILARRKLLWCRLWVRVQRMEEIPLSLLVFLLSTGFFLALFFLSFQ